MSKRKVLAVILTLVVFLELAACLPAPTSGQSGAKSKAGINPSKTTGDGTDKAETEQQEKAPASTSSTGGNKAENEILVPLHGTRESILRPMSYGEMAEIKKESKGEDQGQNRVEQVPGSATPEGGHNNEFKKYQAAEDDVKIVGEDSGTSDPPTKCPHVRCESPPKNAECSEWASTSKAYALSHSDCCPVHLCRRENGSVFYHFGLEIDEIEFSNKQQQQQQPPSTPRSTSYSTGSSQSYSYSNSFQTPPNQQMTSFQVQSSQYPGNLPPTSASANSFSYVPGILKPLPSIVPGLNNGNNPGPFSPSLPGFLFPPFGQPAPGSSLSVQQQNRFLPSVQSASVSFSPVGFGEPGNPLDRTVRTPVAGPIPGFGPRSVPFVNPPQGLWPRFKRQTSDN